MKKKILFIVFVVIVLGGTGYYLSLKNRQSFAPASNGQESVKQATSTINVGGVTIEGSGDMSGVKIEKIETTQDNRPAIRYPLPDLDRKVDVPASISDEAKKIATAKIAEISGRLKQNSDSLEDWLLLGIYRKMVGDLEGAVEVWEYAGKIRPSNSVSFNNLGDLYGYYLKDPVKAEENFKKAIANGPEQIYIYRNFYEFYHFVVKNDAKAKAILEQGIAANPGPASLDLQNLLKTL